MDLFQPFQEPVLKLWEDDTLWSKFVAHDFWKAHHSNPDQKSANDVTLVLLKKNIQFLIINLLLGVAGDPRTIAAKQGLRFASTKL